LSELRDKLAGTIRITAGEHSADTIFWPALAKLLTRCRDTNVEPIIDHGLTDIVAERYDVGVGLDAQVAKDMEGRSWHLCRPRAFLRLTRKISTTS
jgi:DNA-binding transcriptional LysR family regulator